MQICYAVIVSTAERFLVSKVSKLTRPEFISKTVATVDNLCMVDHVKFVMHFKDFMACCNIIIGGIDGWVPSQKYWGPGRVTGHSIPRHQTIPGVKPA